MMSKLSLIATLVLGALTVQTAAAANAAADQTVVELFQSQGCSSCPPAIAILNQLADRPDLLPLDFGVTYWDRLGWKDTFADPAYTARQWAYAKSGGRGEVATPQFIVNGVGVVTGSNARQLAQSIRGEGAKPRAAVISFDGNVISIAAGRTSAPATVWLVRYDPRTRNVNIGGGENGGRVLAHRNVVTDLRALGTWRGAAIRFVEPTYKDAAQRSAIMVQQGAGGPIIAARTL